MTRFNALWIAEFDRRDQVLAQARVGVFDQPRDLPPGRPPEQLALDLLELELEGARASQHADHVVFQAETGRRLEYGKLAALDAEGRALVARFEVAEASRLRLLVEDAAPASRAIQL